MTWSRKDIISDIKKQKFNVNTTLPYWELRAQYRQARYTRAYLASGSFDTARGVNEKPPPTSTEEEMDGK